MAQIDRKQIVDLKIFSILMLILDAHTTEAEEDRKKKTSTKKEEPSSTTNYKKKFESVIKFFLCFFLSSANGKLHFYRLKVHLQQNQKQKKRKHTFSSRF